MNVQTIMLGELAANCHIIDCGNDVCTAVDIGNDAEKLLQFLEKHNLRLGAILLTHGHYDHIGGVETVRVATDVPVYIHEADAPMLRNAALNLASHITIDPYRSVESSISFRDGEEITVGSRTFRVIHTPGHTSGSCCFQTEDVLLSGDTLFRGSIGRTDLGGNPAEMRKSLQKLSALEGEYRIYPGHDSCTTLSIEKKTNPYLRSL